MKTIIISEDRHPGITIDPATAAFSLEQINPRSCSGCWSCWWKTPGQCIYKDLNAFYHEYVHADKAIFIGKVSRGFVSSGMKTLFDRMLPLFLPYMDYATGESMHVPRYPKYPDIEFYYDGEFDSEKSRQIYIDYVNRVFYQFHSRHYQVRPVADLVKEAGGRA